MISWEFEIAACRIQILLQLSYVLITTDRSDTAVNRPAPGLHLGGGDTEEHH